jgi:phage virion morphogenesis protein
MAGIEIHVDTERDEIRPHLRKLARLMGSMQTPLGLIGRELVTSTKERFERSAGPGGTLWPALAPSTIAQRRKGKGSGEDKPLLDTSTLLRSIHSKATNDEVHVGTNHELATDVSAAIHQLGGQAGRNLAVKIPRRSFLGVDEEDEQMIEHTVSEYLSLGGAI